MKDHGSNRPELDSKNPRVYLDIAVGGEAAGRITIQVSLAAHPHLRGRPVLVFGNIQLPHHMPIPHAEGGLCAPPWAVAVATNQSLMRICFHSFAIHFSF
jgi:hypothetical protein